MKLLIVEDDEKIASFLKKGFEEEFFCVDWTKNGDEAFYLVSVNGYDLIVLDVMIEGSGGFETCKKIRQNGITTPIIMLTAKSAIADKVAFLNLGADDYVTKPFSFEELLARIRARLRPREQTEGILKVADLKLDPLSKTANRGGEKISLTAKEYAILEHLMRRENVFVSEIALREALFGYEAATNSNIVNVYIYRLRNKIDKNYEKKLIKTNRNLGFAIVDENV